MRKKLNALGEHLSMLRVQGTQAMQRYVLNHVRGHMQYFGVTGNGGSICEYLFQVERVVFRWLNRRSQRRLVPQDFGLEPFVERLANVIIGIHRAATLRPGDRTA